MLEARVLEWLRVPPEPAAPEGSPGSVRVFRAGRNYYRWRVLMWALSHVTVVFGILLGLATLQPVIRRMPSWAYTGWVAVELVAIVIIIAGLPFTFYLQKLNYRLRWYIVTDRSLRIRSGIWSVEELTMTFANIQDLTVTQDPLQGWLGLSDLVVRSAGGGRAGPNGATVNTHAAMFEGVDNAEAVRDLIFERLRRYRDTGLGEPEQIAAHDPHEAALRVLSEAKALRASMGA
jgi:uncharacterized membrane protein YdbT with pleckstrin-like domain